MWSLRTANIWPLVVRSSLLVRGSIQNSLDATISGKSTKVIFAFRFGFGGDSWDVFR